MTVAVSAAIDEGAKAVICASTGNTAASAAAYAARAGLRGAVIVPGGQDRDRQARPGADARRARDRAARQLRPGARRSSASCATATRSRSSTRSTTTASRGRRPAPSRSATSSARRPTCSASRSATPATSPPSGRASASTRPRRSCTATRPRARRRWSHGAPGRERRRRSRRRSGSATRPAGRRRWTRVHHLARPGPRGDRRRDPRRLRAARLARGRLLRAGLGGLGRRPAQVRRATARVVCVLTGHGLKDPQTAMDRAASVVPCEPDIDAVETAVLGGE